MAHRITKSFYGCWNHTITGNRITSPYQNTFGIIKVIISIRPIPFCIIRTELFRLSTGGAMGNVIRRSKNLGHYIINHIS